MSHWTKIDWLCPGCERLMLTTDHCSPSSMLTFECSCSLASGQTPARGRCHECGQHLEHGEDLCYHFAEHSQAV